MKRERLNNKGFTLIELLAVVVILAVVMGIATTSVLSAMNKSRGGALADSAMVIANAFNQKYTESLVDGVPSDVYGDVLGEGNGYNFRSTAVYYLDKGLANTFKLEETGYAFVNSESSVNPSAVASTDTNELIEGTELANSFVRFDATTGRFVVCLFANKNGSYYVDGYKAKANGGDGSTTHTIANTAYTATIDTMYACSDGTKSW